MQTLKYSSISPQTTRVKKHRKTPRKTVGITLSPSLIEEARKRNLNISRICEQALQSILEYMENQNQTESSKYFLTRGSFQKETRARSSARIEHRAFNPGVPGSNLKGKNLSRSTSRRARHIAFSIIRCFHFASFQTPAK